MENALRTPASPLTSPPPQAAPSPSNSPAIHDHHLATPLRLHTIDGCPPWPGEGEVPSGDWGLHKACLMEAGMERAAIKIEKRPHILLR